MNFIDKYEDEITEILASIQAGETSLSECRDKLFELLQVVREEGLNDH